MGILGMIIGPSGAGKSTSLRNLPPGKVGILNVAGKPLPFKGKIKKVDNPSYEQCKAALRANDFKAYVIDDSTYLMQFEAFKYAKVKGYDKFTDMALQFEQLLEVARKETSDDTVVYFLHHPQFGEDDSSKPQTIGKMLDNQLNIEGLFPVVLECTVKDGEHVFITKNDGRNIAKAPMGMFDKEVIPNDLYEVDKAIRDYWELSPLKEA